MFIPDELERKSAGKKYSDLVAQEEKKPQPKFRLFGKRKAQKNSAREAA